MFTQNIDYQIENFTVVIGLQIKEAIERSDFTADQVAVDADMSVANLYKIYKRDSIETRYLVRICRKLKIPYSQLLGPEEWLEPTDSRGSNVMVANRTGSNTQQYTIGGSGGEEIMRLKHELQLCQVQRESLEQQLSFHKEMIEVLKKK